MLIEDYYNLNSMDQKKVKLMLSVLKYTTGTNYIYVKIYDSQHRIIKVKIHDNSILFFKDYLQPTDYYEEICNKFINYGYIRRRGMRKLSQILESYKEDNIPDELYNKYFIKLYHKEKPTNIERSNLGREWLDYQKQLSKQKNNTHKYIFEPNPTMKCGIWVAKEEFTTSINEEIVQKRYGNNIFIVKTVEGERYVQDDMEVIGDKFEVIQELSIQELLQTLNKYNSISECVKHLKVEG